MMNRSMEPITQRSTLLLIFAALILYIVTLDTGLQPYELEGGDLITHQYAQVQARPSNAPGYPIYTMGGWLWFHGIRTALQLIGIDHPNPMPILSSYSTLWAIIALWLLNRIIMHLTNSNNKLHPTILAWLLPAFLAVTYFFWYYATTTEQYSSAIAQTLAILYVYLLWRGTAPKSSSRTNTPWQMNNPKSHKLLLLLAFLCGISLAHMLTVAFIVPPLIIVVLLDSPHLHFWQLKFWKNKRQIGSLVTIICAGICPLLSYTYIYVRGAAHPEWWGNGPWTNATEWFWSFISTAQGREELGWGLAPDAPLWGGGFPELIWQELTIPLLVLGLIGIAFLGKRLAFILYTTLIIYAIFCWAYRLGNWFQVILPAYPLILIGVAQLLHKLINRSVGTFQNPRPERTGDNNPNSNPRSSALVPQGNNIRVPSISPVAFIIYLVLTAAILWRGSTSLAQNVNSRNRPTDTALTNAQTLLDPLPLNQALPPNATLFGALEDTLALHYLNQIAHIRPDLTVIDRREVAARLQEADATSAPIFSTRHAARRLYDELMSPDRNYGLDLRLRSHGPDWVRVEPITAPAGNQPFPRVRLDQQITDEVFLLGYDYDVGMSGPQQAMFVTLYWQLSNGEWPNGLSISVRPTDNGAFVLKQPDAIIQKDASEPVQGLFDLLRAEPGKTIADPYRIPLATKNQYVANGAMVILYRATESGFENVVEIQLSSSG